MRSQNGRRDRQVRTPFVEVMVLGLALAADERRLLRERDFAARFGGALDRDQHFLRGLAPASVSRQSRALDDRAMKALQPAIASVALILERDLPLLAVAIDDEASGGEAHIRMLEARDQRPAEEPAARYSRAVVGHGAAAAVALVRGLFLFP